MATTETQRNKAISARFCDAMNSNDPEIIEKTIDELVEPDALIRTPLPIGVSGAQALKLVFTTLHRAYPDLHVHVEDMIAEDDKVVTRNRVTGTQLGEYMGIAPTGKSVTYNEIFIFRYRDGRVIETWGVVDVLSQLRQLGAITTTAAALPAA